VLDNVNFLIKENHEKGTINSILAPFGAGKSTLLKIISGVTNNYSGEILLENNNIKNIKSNDIILIPGEPSSFPWLNVNDNILFAEKIINKKLKEENLKKLISLVDLTGYENHFPHESSLGFRFRISLGRAIACQPKLILIDESFKKMKMELRNEMNLLIKNISKELKMNFLLATTNIREAISISEKIFLMEGKPGKIIKEIDVPDESRESDDSKINIYESVRNEIENYFKTKNKLDVINFSI
jgi:NitT/TauT family transport system ATP-binding protein